MNRTMDSSVDFARKGDLLKLPEFHYCQEQLRLKRCFLGHRAAILELLWWRGDRGF